KDTGKQASKRGCPPLEEQIAAATAAGVSPGMDSGITLMGSNPYASKRGAPKPGQPYWHVGGIGEVSPSEGMYMIDGGRWDWWNILCSHATSIARGRRWIWGSRACRQPGCLFSRDST